MKSNPGPFAFNKRVKAFVSGKLLLIIVLTGLLSACGDNSPTVSTGVLTTATQTTLAASPTTLSTATSIPITAAATTSALTTAAATTSALTTAAATSTPMLVATTLTSSGTTAAASATTSASTSDALVKQFAGKYTTTITKEDLDKYPVQNYRSDLADNIGSWVQEYSQSGTLKLILDGGTIGEAHYTLTQGQLTITDSICRQNFGVVAETGTYRWQLNDKTLTLVAISDKCPIRRFTQTARPWTKS